MRGLVGDHRLQGARGLEFQDHARIDEDVLGVCDKGVEPGVVHHHHPYLVGAETSPAQHGRGQLRQTVLHIRVAQQVDGTGGQGTGQNQRQSADNPFQLGH